MDEAAAAALVLAFAGEASLRAGSVELPRLAAEVARVADAVRAPRDDLAAAAEALSRADDATRLQAVVTLGQAATSLEHATAARQGVLRRAMASLSRSCRERGGTGTTRILHLADEVWFAAAGVGVPRDSLERAGKALLRALRAGADDAARTLVVIDLVREATALEKAAGARLAVLGRGAASLALACQEYRRVADAIPVVRCAAEAAWAQQGDGQLALEAARAQQNNRSNAGAWWPWRPWLRRTKTTAPSVPDMEATLLEKSESTPPSAPAGESSQSQGAMAEKTSGTQGYALYGSLTLIPGFGPDGLLKSFSSSNFRWWFTVIFCSWWSMVAAGVPCSLFPHTKLDVVYADLTTRLGMIGINVLVVMYVCWMLAVDATFVFTFLLIGSVAVHIFFSAWHYYHARGGS